MEEVFIFDWPHIHTINEIARVHLKGPLFQIDSISVFQANVIKAITHAFQVNTLFGLPSSGIKTWIFSRLIRIICFKIYIFAVVVVYFYDAISFVSGSVKWDQFFAPTNRYITILQNCFKSDLLLWAIWCFFTKTK